DTYSDKFFYHIYPLGMCGCPRDNDFSSPRGYAFETLSGELERIRALGVNALYIGPIFESSHHGYDTVDYYHVDRRLGNNESFKDFVNNAHNMGFVVILDAVFNHTGRDFFAFRNLKEKKESSLYKSWYENIVFSRDSGYGDGFDYNGWAGCKDLVKLNLGTREVRDHLLGAVKYWIEEFHIDGLRLDAADVLRKDFLDELSSFSRSLKPDFWLMGEVVNGNYSDWVREGRLDSVTNYQIYKPLWSAINSDNLFELQYNLDREFGQYGIYRYSPLYNFLDNHDVNRLASTLKNARNKLHVAYGLLFAIPGIPSVYYGSEYAMRGVRHRDGDYELRPTVVPFGDTPEYARPSFDSSFLPGAISSFAYLRRVSNALSKGDYQTVSVTNKTLVFARTFYSERVLVICSIEEIESGVH
ncbi:MAG: alpha-amylase, partial [Spirochaetales bacterium]|nr:alpha-amylase [Candidatus Physcosoma equi]